MCSSGSSKYWCRNLDACKSHSKRVMFNVQQSIAITILCIVCFKAVTRGLDDVSNKLLKWADVPGIDFRLITTSKTNFSEIHIPGQRPNIPSLSHYGPWLSRITINMTPASGYRCTSHGLELIFPTWSCTFCHKLLQSHLLRHFHYLNQSRTYLVIVCPVSCCWPNFNPFSILAIHSKKRRETIITMPKYSLK